ncbi:MAG: DNA-3-methyladenine glycosylase 2 family protein [Sphingobacteriales bacterium]|nr:DNA-3-methyladenine glycosylase 2 family protein [Sphingobacteriales bacterium]
MNAATFHTARQHLMLQDAVMARLIADYPIEVHYEEAGDIYETLLDAIISQQLSVKAAAAIVKEFKALFGGYFPAPHLLLQHDTEFLRTAGISNQKAGYLLNIAHFWTDNNLQTFDFQQYSDDEVLQLLTQIKGVGCWTVEMILIFALYRNDVFSVGDLGIRKAVARHYEIAAPIESRAFAAEAAALSESWRPYRSYACRYLWASLDNS